MSWKLPWPQKQMLWAFGKGILQLFASFCMTKLKSLSGKVKQSVQNCLNQNLLKRSFLENGFGGILSSKTDVACAWKIHFSDFDKFFSDQSEITSWQSEGKRSRLLEWKFGRRKYHRKCFSYLDFKSQCCKHLKRAFLSFLLIFEWRIWNPFLEKWRKAFKAISIKI